MNATAAPAGSARDREIVAAIVTCARRNFVTLKTATRSGIVGIGDARLEDGSMWDR